MNDTGFEGNSSPPESSFGSSGGGIIVTFCDKLYLKAKMVTVGAGSGREKRNSGQPATCHYKSA